MVGALASGPIGPSCFCHSPPSHVIEVDDVRIYCPLIGCGVKEQCWGRFLSRGFRWAFCKASMKAEDVVADGFFEFVSVIHQLFKVISHPKKKKKKWVAESGIISCFFIYLFSTLMGVFSNDWDFFKVFSIENLSVWPCIPQLGGHGHLLLFHVWIEFCFQKIVFQHLTELESQICQVKTWAELS